MPGNFFAHPLPIIAPKVPKDLKGLSRKIVGHHTNAGENATHR